MAQITRPNGADTDGNWGTSPPFGNLWDVTSDQSDGTYAELTTLGSSEFIVTLSGLTDPGVHTGHVIKMKAAMSSSSQNFTLKLYEGATQRKSASHTVSSPTFTEFTTTLSEAEASAITDYTNLKVGVTANYFGPDTKVSELSFEVPDASPPPPPPPPSASSVDSIKLESANFTFRGLANL